MRYTLRWFLLACALLGLFIVSLRVGEVLESPDVIESGSGQTLDRVDDPSKKEAATTSRHDAGTEEIPDRDQQPMVIRGPERKSPEGTFLAGRTVDENGNTLAGVTVQLLHHQNAFVTVQEPLGIQTTTDGAGSFLFEGPPSQIQLAIEATKKGYARTISSTVTATPSGTTRAPDIVMSRGISLAGEVLSEENLAPISDARIVVTDYRPQVGVVRVDSLDAMGSHQARSDSNGNFNIDGLGTTHYLIHVSAEGHANRTLSRSFIAVRKGQEVEISVVLSPAHGEAEGYVVSNDGAPIGKATIEAIQKPGGFDSHSLRTTAQQNGAFLLTGMADGTYELTANAMGYHQDTPITATPGQDDVTIVMARNGAISGRIVTAEGKAPRGATARVLRVPRGTGNAYLVKRAIVDSQTGELKADNLTPGDYILEADAKGSALTRSPDIRVDSGATTANVVLRLDFGGSLRGHAIRNDDDTVGPGQAVLLPGDFDASSPVAEIIFLRPVQNQTQAWNANGSFQMDHVRAGTYQIRLSTDSGDVATIRDVTVTEGEENDLGDLAIPRSGSLKGEAREIDGKPMAGVRVVASSSVAGFRTSTMTNNRGHFSFPHLPPGPYEVAIDFGGTARALDTRVLKEITVVPQEQQTVILLGAEPRK